jgi:phosphoglycolate phosphatase-like HAD superfamily hydrolase
MEMTDKEIHLLARLSRDRGLYAECKGADLDALQQLGLLQWFDARLSTTPFKEDPRPLFKLLLMNGRIEYFWVESVENWRELVGPEVAAKVDAIDEIEWAVNSGPFTGAGWFSRQGLAQRVLLAPSPARDDTPSRQSPTRST